MHRATVDAAARRLPIRREGSVSSDGAAILRPRARTMTEQASIDRSGLEDAIRAALTLADAHDQWLVAAILQHALDCVGSPIAMPMAEAPLQ